MPPSLRVALPRALQPGDEIHYVSLLDEDGNPLATCAMEKPLVVTTTEGADVDVTVSLSVRLMLHGKTLPC